MREHRTPTDRASRPIGAARSLRRSQSLAAVDGPNVRRPALRSQLPKRNAWNALGAAALVVDHAHGVASEGTDRPSSALTARACPTSRSIQNQRSARASRGGDAHWATRIWWHYAAETDPVIQRFTHGAALK